VTTSRDVPDGNTLQDLFEGFDGLAGPQRRTQLQAEIPTLVWIAQDIGADDGLPLVDDFDVIGSIPVDEHATRFPMVVGGILVACPAAWRQIATTGGVPTTSIT
jgi:hypothetical protein